MKLSDLEWKQRDGAGYFDQASIPGTPYMVERVAEKYATHHAPRYEVGMHFFWVPTDSGLQRHPHWERLDALEAQCVLNQLLSEVTSDETV